MVCANKIDATIMLTLGFYCFGQSFREMKDYDGGREYNRERRKMMMTMTLMQMINK